MAGGEEAEEVMRLRERLWRSRRRRASYGGIALLVIGLLSLPILLITHDLVFEITFLLTMPVGLLLIFRSVETYVRAGTSSVIFTSLLYDFKALSDALLVDDRPLFVPTGKGEVQVCFGDSSSGKSVVLPELAKPLTSIYELELGRLSGLELRYLSMNLPKVIVDGLQLAEAARIEAEGDNISFTVERPTFWTLYLEDGLKPLYDKIGCPLAWSVAESIAKSSGRIVRYVGYECSERERLLRYRYVLGPGV